MTNCWAVTSFTSFDEAIALTNCTNYGLAAAIFTRDLVRALRFAHFQNNNPPSNYDSLKSLLGRSKFDQTFVPWLTYLTVH